MSEDLDIDAIPPGRYDATVKKIRFDSKRTKKIVITYALDTPTGVRELDETILIQAPTWSAAHFHTTKGLARVEALLRTQGLALADARTAGGLKALPGMLEGVAIRVVTRNQNTLGFDTSTVVRIEKI